MSKKNATLEDVTAAYRSARKAGCLGNGTLTINKVRFVGWQFVERMPDGTLGITDANGTDHYIALRA